MRTDGFMPTIPFNRSVYPGDFFQLRNGEMIMLGNIFMNNIIDPGDVNFGYGVKLNPSNWHFNSGVSKPYSGRGKGHGPLEGDFEFSKQIISFASRGSFLFKGHHPEVVKLQNWNEIQHQLIIKLTQTLYSFRELYVVTESVVLSDWTLAVSSSEKGKLEIATDTENFGLLDIFGHHTSKTIQSEDLEYYHRETKKKPVFFKAKKLTVQEEKMETFISDFTNKWESRQEWASNFYDYDFHHEPMYTREVSSNTQASVLDMLQSNELNPNTALLYFRWADASLDDIEKLFVSYGN